MMASVLELSPRLFTSERTTAMMAMVSAIFFSKALEASGISGASDIGTGDVDRRCGSRKWCRGGLSARGEGRGLTPPQGVLIFSPQGSAMAERSGAQVPDDPLNLIRVKPAKGAGIRRPG